MSRLIRTIPSQSTDDIGTAILHGHMHQSYARYCCIDNLVQFLKDTLANGPKPVTTVEEQATKCHIDPQTLDQARAELGIVTSRSNTGGVQAVQWSLP